MKTLNGKSHHSFLPPLLQALFRSRSLAGAPELLPDEVFAELKTCPVISYSSGILLDLPWAASETAPSRRPRTIEVDLGGDRSWRVIPGPGGLPGPFEREVFRALEWMALETFFQQGRRFVNPLLFLVPEICERLCLKELAPTFRAIDRSIRLLGEIQIERSGTARWSGPERSKLIDRVAFDPRPGPHRRPAFRRHALFFGRVFVDSVNSGGIRAMNWGLWISLRHALSRRLVELLDFAPATGGVPKPLTITPERLARFLPFPGLTESLRFRRLLERAHEELVERKYLEKVEWTGAPQVLVYHPGVAQLAIARLLRRQGLPVPPLPVLPAGIIGTA